MAFYQFYYYVPETHLEETKEAIFAVGAGRMCKYSDCAWQTKGMGQYRPEEGSNPYRGTQGILERTEDYKVEIICSEEVLSAAVNALMSVHPYECPAYGVIRLEEVSIKE